MSQPSLNLQIACVAGVLLLGMMVLDTSAADRPLPDNLKIQYWSMTTTLRSGGGYKDNVLLGNTTNTQGSIFWSSGGDVMVFRLPSHGWQFMAFVSFDNTKYFNRSVGAGNEQLGLLTAQLTKSFSHDWNMGLGVNLTYINQVIDTSAILTNGAPNTEVLGETLMERWFIRKDFKPYWTEAELNLARQWFAAPLDGAWQPGARLTVGRSLGIGSSLSLTYRWSGTEFDTREQITTAGYTVAGTRLRFQSHDVEADWDQVWDQPKHWHTTTKAGLDCNLDNGSGYFDFWQYRLSEQLKYQAKTWDVSVQCSLNYYDFSVQTASLTDLALRQQTLFSASLLAEKNLGKSFKMFGGFSYGQSFSNTSYDNYKTSTTSAGVEYHF